MAIAGTLLAVALFGLINSAIFFAIAYFCVNKWLEPDRRSKVAGLLAFVLAVAFIIANNTHVALKDWLNPLALAALVPWLLGLGFWTWRTHAADMRDAAGQTA